MRLVLAALNVFGLCVLRRAVSRRFGFRTGVFFALLSTSQFHLPFWIGRTLPNMFALLPGMSNPYSHSTAQLRLTDGLFLPFGLHDRSAGVDVMKSIWPTVTY